MSVNRDWAHAMICIRMRMILRSIGSPVMGVTGAGKPARMVGLSFSMAEDTFLAELTLGDTIYLDSWWVIVLEASMIR